jgi:exosortase/archaeosortase family protein
MSNTLLNKINDLIKKYHLYAFKDVIIFMIILLAFHVLWKIFVTDILDVDFIRNSAHWLAGVVYETSKWFFEITGMNIIAFDQLKIFNSTHDNVFFYAETNGYVYVNLSCSGLKQFYQWFFLMLLYPGPWKHKLWFIPLGLIIIHIVNVFRIIGMVVVTMNIPEHWDFMHDYVMRPFFYVVMFFLWVWWNEKIYIKSKKAKATAKG